MAFGVSGEVSGVTLSYVARNVEGEVKTSKAVFDKNLSENVLSEEVVEDAIIVFFPNKTCQIMSAKQAASKGFLNQPEIMNFSQVQDQKTPAGRYKNAIRNEQREQAWLDMENTVINACASRSGHPLPLTCTIATKSLYLQDVYEKEIA